MSTHNADNERIKRQYFAYLKEATRLSEQSVDAAAKAISRFETYTKFRDFKTFHRDQAVAFKKRLAEQQSETTGETLSKSTLNSTLVHLKRFFQWLAWLPGYRSRINPCDAEYFNLSGKDTRIATARRQKAFPTLEQVKHVISNMPSSSEVEQRDRALIAFTLLTGARDSAIASLKLKHVDLERERVYQDAREVKTKFSKTFDTYFFSVGADVQQVVADWVNYLRGDKLWGKDDPVFPATNVVVGQDRRFIVNGLKREHWSTAGPIRDIFRQAFQIAGLPYFNPHSLRDTLSQLAQVVCRTPREFKAYSQNLGHEGVLTTLCSYGPVANDEQGEIIRGLAKSRNSERIDVEEIAEAVARKIAESTIHLREVGLDRSPAIDSKSRHD